MTKCYAQFTHPSLAAAFPDQYETFDSLKEAEAAFYRLAEEMDRFGDGRESTGLVWSGEPDPEALYPCDMCHFYPDFELVIGRRWGIQRNKLS